MTLRIASFQPTMIAMDDVPPNIYSKIFSLTENLHRRVDLDDADDATNGKIVNVFPNPTNNVDWLITWIESVAEKYMELITTQSSTEDLTHCKPVVTTIWSTRQYQGDYQEMHTQLASHLSGNVYVQVPELDPNSKPTDGQALFRMLQTKDLSKFIMTDTWKFIPQQATVILFPSHIPNTLYPWNGNGYRTILSFNIVLSAKDE
jgi:hypothetical protein